MPPRNSKFTRSKLIGYLVVAVAVGLSGLWGLSRARGPAAPPGQEARLVTVIDGDTVRVRFGGQVQTARLLGIDTPETKHSRRLAQRAAQRRRSAGQEARLGSQATDHLKKLTPPGSLVYLRFDPQQGRRDRHGRLLVYLVNADGVLANREMVALGFARMYRRFRFEQREPWLALEQKARQARVGLWAHVGGP